ncbi:MAG: rRNA (cytidine-2'-O-)-methyltransferase, partial [Thermosipho sp. (in: Bacteria)]|nr:rRNA (cytidine-2'-O-)-methyltransferase [Thermosipho sp. (in: thermotogales)]
MQGKLVIIGTPIGNIEDITLRALKVLKEVDLILSEDTRRTLKLLNYYSISKPIDSFNEHSSDKKK